MRHGYQRDDGATAVVWDGKHCGWLMPPVTPSVLRASPGITAHSTPGTEGIKVKLDDKGASILSFSDYCRRHLIPHYPHTRRDT